MYDAGLTIVIPTFNREDKLKSQLRNLFNKNSVREIKIIVVDNNSSYDINKSLVEEFSADLLDNLEIVTRPFNLGLGMAITMPFLICKTKWLWILGDDDEVVGDLEVLLRDLERFSMYAFLKYNIKNVSTQENTEISTIDDFLHYYWNRKHPTGDLVFISNGLFNLTLLNKYLGLALIWSGTLIGHLIPVLFGLCENEIKCRMINYDLVEYNLPPKGQEHELIWVTLGISLIGDIEFPVSQKINRKIHHLVQRDISHLRLISSLMDLNNRKRRKYSYVRIYNSCYNLGIKNKVYKILFICSHLLNVNFPRYILSIMDGLFNYMCRNMPYLREYIKKAFPNHYRGLKFW